MDNENVVNNFDEAVEEKQETNHDSATVSEVSPAENNTKDVPLQPKKKGWRFSYIFVCLIWLILLAFVFGIINFISGGFKLPKFPKFNLKFFGDSAHHIQIDQDVDEFDYDIDVDEDDFEFDSDYLFPSDKRLISEQYLDNLTKDEVALVRNEIYARHGYIFNSEYYQQYFASKSWYRPNPGFSEEMFSEIEKMNKTTIVEYEKSRGWR